MSRPNELGEIREDELSFLVPIKSIGENPTGCASRHGPSGIVHSTQFPHAVGKFGFQLVGALVIEPEGNPKKSGHVLRPHQGKKFDLVAVGPEDHRDLRIRHRTQDIEGIGQGNHRPIPNHLGHPVHASQTLPFEESHQLRRTLGAQVLAHFGGRPVGQFHLGLGPILGAAVGHEEIHQEFSRASGMPLHLGLQVVLGLGPGHAGQGPTLGNRPMEESPGGGGQQQAEHVGAASRFAKDRNPTRITAENRDLIAHPLQGSDRIEGAVVARTVRGRGARRPQPGMGEPTENTQTVLEGHHHHALPDRQHAAVVDLGAPDGIATAMNPNHHGEPGIPGFSLSPGRREDIQEEAVLAAHHVPGFRL